MARKSYSEEFRRQAAELYESTPGATYLGIAADLGITRNTLKNWVASLGSASTASTNGANPDRTAVAPRPRASARSRGAACRRGDGLIVG